MLSVGAGVLWIFLARRGWCWLEEAGEVRISGGGGVGVSCQRSIRSEFEGAVGDGFAPFRTMQRLSVST